MSYNIKPKSGAKSGPITGNRIQNVESTLRLIKEISTEENKFYELEPVEVLEVHLSQAIPGTSTYEGLSQELSSRRGAKASIPVSQKMRQIQTTGDPSTRSERAQAFLDELRRNQQG